MHLSLKHSTSLEEGENPVNPDQSPADMLVLSFTDSDLSCMAEAYQLAPELPSLCLTSLAPLKHPLSVDLYIEQVAAHARAILVRIIGGYEWWRYGAEELGRIAREKSIPLIMVPGDCSHDARLTALSTVSPELIAAIDACLQHGGPENARETLRCLAALASGNTLIPTALPMPNGALYVSPTTRNPQPTTITATILFYRAHHLAADTQPIDALLSALAKKGFAARAFMVASLKDPAALAALRADLAQFPAGIILDATAFSAGENAHPLADLNVPILQCALANASHDAWQQSQRGLSTTDLAMHVVLPEADGRIFTRAISFKTETGTDAASQCKRILHRAHDDRIEYVAELAAAWANLAQKPASARNIALILSDYPDRAGRSAFAVGLDAPQSAVGILQLLKNAGYTLSEIPESGGDLLASLRATETYPLSAYLKRFHTLPEELQTTLTNAWGSPETDFKISALRSGNLTIALQPDRGSAQDRKTGYHDPIMPPRHSYLAFYWWLRDTANIDALIHLGTHGNLEWLPGKSVALSASCWPEIALGATPVLYPYIVSDPGEAAQAKRRISAVTISHLTPPLAPVSLSPELAELETLVDEFSSADGLDARRMKILREEILHRARRSGLPGEDDNTLMTALETHLCDIKEQRVGDGLHIFATVPPPQCCNSMSDALIEISGGTLDKNLITERIHASAAGEAASLLAGLAGRFIMPGPGGSPVRGRLDILPTGRNMVTVDPRMIPTPTAAIIGKRTAEAFVTRYVQDHGDWPRHVVIDLWGSATLRNGGDEIAQALHLMGVNAVWDNASHRVTGFEILAPDTMAWPRIDVSLRISGLFRDMFANLITLFDDAVCAVALLDEPAHTNPLAASARHLAPAPFREATWRIFGNAPGAYGAGTASLIDSGAWQHRDELGRAYLQSSRFAYGRDTDGSAQIAALKDRVSAADAFIHVQDQREMDVLSGADFADAEGGFSAAAQLLGSDPALYHIDTSRTDTIKARSLAEEISLTLHARALGAKWIEGQMRHGYAGAAALAEVIDQLFAFAATTDAVASAQFDAVFDAYMHDDTVRDFLKTHNPEALKSIAARLDEAIARGLWKPLRNSAWSLLEQLRAGGLAA